MYLFIYENFRGGIKSDLLVERALELYLYEKGIESDPKWNFTIKRSRSGKPYFQDAPISFSVSHTGSMWVCLMGTENAGVDIQEKRHINSDELARRFFTEEEEDYVRLWGITGFLQIWVRKEAIIKYLGITLGEGLTKYETVSGGELLNEIKITGGTLFIKDIVISDEVQCACALCKDTEVHIRSLD